MPYGSIIFMRVVFYCIKHNNSLKVTPCSDKLNQPTVNHRSKLRQLFCYSFQIPHITWHTAVKNNQQIPQIKPEIDTCKNMLSISLHPYSISKETVSMIIANSNTSIIFTHLLLIITHTPTILVGVLIITN